MQHGRSTEGAEVTHVSRHGFRLFVGEREIYASFKDFPWFEDASIRQITTVEMPAPHHLYWPELDVDLAVDALDHPDRYPLVSQCRARGADPDGHRHLLPGPVPVRARRARRRRSGPGCWCWGAAAERGKGRNEMTAAEARRRGWTVGTTADVAARVVIDAEKLRAWNRPKSTKSATASPAGTANTARGPSSLPLSDPGRSPARARGGVSDLRCRSTTSPLSSMASPCRTNLGGAE